MNPSNPAAVFAALCLCAAALADAPTAPAPSAPGWAWGAVTPTEGGSLEETHGFGVVAQAPASLAPGRYRLTVTARFSLPASSLLVVHLPAGTHDYPPEIRSASGYPADRPDTWKTLRYDFDVESGLKAGPTLDYADYQHLNAGTPGRLQIQAASLRVEKLPPAVGVSYARPAKIRYKPGEAGVVEASLTNGTAKAQTVRVRAALVDENELASPGPPHPVTVPALSTLAVTLPFTAPRAQGGYEAQAQIVDGARVVDAKGDVFADTDNPFAFSIRGSWGAHYFYEAAHTLAEAKALQADHWDGVVDDNTGGIRWMRSEYVTYCELFCWAHEDATLMTEATDEPYLAGQAAWPTSRKLLKLVTGLLHAQGIAPVGYANAEPFGWPAFELFRRNPEWFSYRSPGGPPSAGFSTESLAQYDAGTKKAGGDYPFIEPSWEAVSQATGKRYVDYHVQQDVDSAQDYGWEAFRYDAGTPPPKYWPLIKARLAALTPPVFLGSNQAINNLGPVQTPLWNLYCRDGSLMMEESINDAFDNPNSPRRGWAAWRDFQRTGADLTRRNGGYYQFIDASGNWLATTCGYAVGGHPYSHMAYQNPFGTNERFMLHYGGLFWDRRSQLMPPAQVKQAVAVASTRPLWWDTSVNERTFSALHRQVIVPLINPPTGDTVNDTKISAQASGVRVTLTPKPGEAVQAFLYAPEPVARRSALALTRLPGGRVSVSVPPFWAWTNVVFECRKGTP